MNATERLRSALPTINDALVNSGNFPYLMTDPKKIKKEIKKKEQELAILRNRLVEVSGGDEK